MIKNGGSKPPPYVDIYNVPSPQGASKHFVFLTSFLRKRRGGPIFDEGENWWMRCYLAFVTFSFGTPHPSRVFTVLHSF